MQPNESKICNQNEDNLSSYHKSVSGTLNSRVITGTSTKAHLAAQQVTPAKLAQLLLNRGPLAIRFITQSLSEEIPGFKDLSASKQRRLIMSALEAGEKEKSVVFAKIGWGQWSAKLVNPQDFLKERELTNLANMNVKDLIAQERRCSTSNKKSLLRQNMSSNSGPTTMYIDENAVASDDDCDEHERRLGDDNSDSEIYHHDRLKRRQSGVLTVDSSPEMSGNHIFNTACNDPLIPKPRSKSFNPSYRYHNTCSKIRSPSISKTTQNFKNNINNTFNESIDASLRRMSTSSNSDYCPKSVIDLSLNISLGSNKLEHESKVQRISNLRASVLSFNKESSLRSTLLPHPNYEALSSSDTKHPSLNLSPNGKHNSDSNIVISIGHSDTDEEDWQSIGAASLRRNEIPLNKLERSISHNKESVLSSSNKIEYQDTNDVATLLLSLKS